MPEPLDHLWTCSRHEYELWGKLCRELFLRRVITTADLNSPAGSADTPGNRLLNLIKEWGDARGTLALAAAAARKEKSDG